VIAIMAVPSCLANRTVAGEQTILVILFRGPRNRRIPHDFQHDSRPTGHT